MLKLTILLLIVLFTLPVAAQGTGCDIDFQPVYDELTQADNAQSSDTALEHIARARVALETIEAQCALQTTMPGALAIPTLAPLELVPVQPAKPGIIGISRTDPAPLGERVMIGDIQGSIEVVDYDANANHQWLSPDPGHHYILVEINFYCETSVNETCTLTSGSFSAVGDNSVSYPADWIVFEMDTSLDLFGGGEGSMFIPIEVSDDDANFVLFYDRLFGDGDTFFALE